MGLRQLSVRRARPVSGFPVYAGLYLRQVFQTSSANIPAYNSAGAFSFPDFSQASIFENPVGQYPSARRPHQFNPIL